MEHKYFKSNDDKEQKRLQELIDDSISNTVSAKDLQFNSEKINKLEGQKIEENCSEILYTRLNKINKEINDINEHIDESSGTTDFLEFKDMISTKEDLESIEKYLKENMEELKTKFGEHADQHPEMHLIFAELDLIKQGLDNVNDRINSLSPSITPEQEEGLLNKKEMLDMKYKEIIDLINNIEEESKIDKSNFN